MTKQQRKKEFFRQILLGKKSLEKNDIREAFTFFENAHVLGQHNLYRHTLSHYYMFLFGIKTRDSKEILGQFFRFFAAIFITPIWVPKGNTGGSNVSAIKPMPIKKEFQKYFL